MQSSSQVAPEEAIKTVQMVLAPSQGRPLPPVHLENVSLGLLLPPPQVCHFPHTCRPLQRAAVLITEKKRACSLCPAMLLCCNEFGLS